MTAGSASTGARALTGIDPHTRPMGHTLAHPQTPHRTIELSNLVSHDVEVHHDQDRSGTMLDLTEKGNLDLEHGRRTSEEREEDAVTDDEGEGEDRRAL